MKHGMYKDNLYLRWRSMKRRCYRKKDISYENYGGRGIEVCSEWKNSFKSFYNWSLTNGYKPELWIDRINNDGNYEPSNCRWATAQEQQLNKRIRKDNRSGFSGITWENETKKWRVEFKINNARVRLGRFFCLKKAKEALEFEKEKFK